MSKTLVFVRLTGFLAISLLAACEVYPTNSLEREFDRCDRQAEYCRIAERDSTPFYDERGRRIGCVELADRCFASAYALGRSREISLPYGYVFFGRAGRWSPRYGFVPGPHGRSFTYRRYGNTGYTDRYYRDDRYYDDPYDCFGYRRAYYCDDYNRRRRGPGGPGRRDDDRDDQRELPRIDKPTTQPDRDRPVSPPARPVPRIGDDDNGGSTPSVRPQPRPLPPVRPQPRPEPRPSPPARPSRPDPSPPPPARPQRPSRPQPAPPPARPEPKPEPAPKPQPRPSRPSRPEPSGDEPIEPTRPGRDRETIEALRDAI